MNREYLNSENGLDYYLYRPTLIQLYYPCYQNEGTPPYFARLPHKIRMVSELLFSQYQVIYMMKNGKTVGHFVVARGGRRIVFSTKNDIVIGPIWVVPSERGKGYASEGIRFILTKLALDYHYAYEFISESNKASIRTVEKNGFEFIDKCRVSRISKKVVQSKDGGFMLWRKQNHMRNDLPNGV